MNKKITDFRPLPKNPNKHTLHGERLVEKSIQADGFIDAQTSAANGTMISGSTRQNIAAEKFADVEPIVIHSDGQRPVIVIRDDIPDENDPRAKRLAVAANQAANTNYEPDGDLLAEWGGEDEAIRAMFADSEWKEITGEEKPTKDAEPAVDKAQELLDKWQVKTGDLFAVGLHRLICGDCTDAAVVARVMDEERAALVVTSPPYFNQRPEYAIFESYEKYNAFLSNVIDGILSITGDPFVLAWNTGDNQPDCLPMIADQTTLIHGKGLTYLDTIIWKKSGAVYSIPRSAHIRSHNYYYPALAWEPIIVFRVGDKMPKFDEKDANAVSNFGINVWEIQQVNGGVQDKTGHPAMFPAELAERVVMAYSITGATVYEPFSGSGTTLVACQNLSRFCRAVEISPAYVAVALERMSTAFPDLDIRRLE